MLILWGVVVALTVSVAIAKEFVDKKQLSKWGRRGWTVFIVAVASAAGILNVIRAEASGRAMATVVANIAFRTCTPEQGAAIKKSLAGYPTPSTPVRVISVSGDRESTSFGGELADAIKAAGWPTTEENLPFTRASYGLEIRFEGMVENPVESSDSDVTNCPLCHSLAKALEHAGQHATVFMWPRVNVGMPPDPTIELIVGYKPIPPE